MLVLLPAARQPARMMLAAHPLHVPTTTRDALAAGWTQDRLHRAVVRGDVRRVLRGVYVDASAPDSLALRSAAAALVLPARMVVCDRSASWLQGVDHWDPRDLDVPPLLDVVARSGVVIVVRKEDLSGDRLDAWVRRLRASITERRRAPTPTYARGLDAGVHLRRRQ